MKNPMVLYIVLIITDLLFLVWDIVRGSYVFAAIMGLLAVYLIVQTVRLREMMQKMGNKNGDPPENK